MAKSALAGRNQSGAKGAGNGEVPCSQYEQAQLFPKLKRTGRSYKTTLSHLEEQLAEMPEVTYQAVDDDLPVIFWPEPNFD